MRSGPRAKPTALKLLEGNPGKQKINKNEPKPRAIMPKPPKHLCSVGLKTWRRVTEGLFYMGIIGDIDRDALAAYCASYALWERSWIAIKEMLKEDLPYSGLVTKSDSGKLIQNPLISVANKAAADMVRYASEFGMTPSSRARLSIGPTGRPEDEKLKRLLFVAK